MITIYRKTHRIDKKLSELRNLHALWVQVENPTEKELQELLDAFHLERGHLTDALDPHEVPRYEHEGDVMYIYTRFPIEYRDEYGTTPILFVFSQRWFISISKLPLPFPLDELTIRSMSQSGNAMQLLFQLFSRIGQLYYSVITKINKRVAVINANVDSIQNRDIIKFVGYEHILSEFINAVIQTNLILKNLLVAQKGLPQFYDKDQLEDIFLLTGQLIDFSKSSLTRVKNLRDAYSTILTNNLNRVVKLFTTLTIILMIPTIVTSFYGMNVRLPLQGHSMAYALIMIVTVALSAGLLAFFHKKQLL